MKRVCIVGATSHVAKALIAENHEQKSWLLSLVARSPKRVEEFLHEATPGYEVPCFSMEHFLVAAEGADAIINCVGFGTPEKVKSSGISLFTVTEEIDNAILEFVANYPETRYINFSSGAVYGTAMAKPVQPGQNASLEVSPLNPAEFYRISKIHQEAKHRACPKLAITDIRLFSFFSRFIDQSASYLMCDITRSLSTGDPLRTNSTEIYRDYISPADLYSLVNCILSAAPSNTVVDSYSRSAIGKTELLTKLSEELDLKVELLGYGLESPTGPKPYYYSENRASAESIGYSPRLSSWEAIRTELGAIAKNRDRASTGRVHTD